MTHIQAIGIIMADGQWHDTTEIYQRVCGHERGMLAISARIHDLRKMGCLITDARDANAITEKRGIRRYRCDYMPKEAKLKLGLVSLPAYPQEGKAKQGMLFSLDYM